MLPIKRRRDRQKEKKAQQRTGVSISIPTSTPRLGGPQPPALPRIMFRNRATTSSDETNAGASTDITTERHKVRIVSEVQKPRSNKERNNNNNGMNRSPSGNHQHGSESNATRLSDDIVLEHAHQPDTTDTAITDNTITDNTTPTLTADSTNTDVIMLDDDDDDDGVTDANARPITTTEFDDRAYSIPKHYRWPKMQLTNFAMGQAIPKITSNSHLLPWQIQHRHSVPVNTSFSMLREVTSERSDHSLSVFPLLSNIWYQHTIMDRPLHDQLAAQLQDVVYQVWQHFITPKEEHNSSEHTTSQVNELPRELPGPLVDAAVIDMIETFRKLLLCMIQLKQQTGFTQKSGGFDNWRAVCAAAHSINMPSKVIDRVKRKMSL